jgi:hypothetical protein
MMTNSQSLQIDLPKYLFNSPIEPNGLALYAADWYLQCLRFETKHDDRDDWWIQYLSKSACLEIVGIGQIECISVTNDATTVNIPSDLADDSPQGTLRERIGYLFVKVNESATSAEILGFMPKYHPVVKLDRLQSTDELIDYLSNLETQTVPTIDPSITASIIKLSDWAQGIFDGIWQDSNGNYLTPAYRSIKGLLSIKTTGGNRRVKLGDRPDSPIVIIAIDYHQIDPENFDLYLQVLPEDRHHSLPQGLKFSAIDDRGNEIGSIQISDGDIAGEIVLEHGAKGEVFSIELEFVGVKKVESFEI